MGTYVSSSHGESSTEVARAISRALVVLREHQSDLNGRCVICEAPCIEREAAVAIFARYMREPPLVRPYIKV
jgi:hypothetical protein